MRNNVFEIFEIKEEQSPEKISANVINLFFEAIKKGDFAAVNTFINLHKNCQLEDEQGNTALHYAAQYGHIDIIKELITSNTKINAQNQLGCTPLHLAAQNNQTKIIDVLIEAGANPNSITWSQVTPAHLIAQNGNLEAIQSFSKWQMNPLLEDSNKHNAWFYLRAFGNIEAYRSLLANGLNMECSYNISVANLYWIFGGEKLSEVLNIEKEEAVHLIEQEFQVNKKIEDYLIRDQEEVFKLFFFHLVDFLVRKNINFKKSEEICNQVKTMMTYKFTKNSHLEIMTKIANGEAIFITRTNPLHANIVSFQINPNEKNEIILNLIDKSAMAISSEKITGKEPYIRKLRFSNNLEILEAVITTIRESQQLPHLKAKEKLLTELPKVTQSHTKSI